MEEDDDDDDWEYFFRKYSMKIVAPLKSDKNNGLTGTVPEELRVFTVVPWSVLLRIGNASEK